MRGRCGAVSVVSLSVCLSVCWGCQGGGVWVEEYGMGEWYKSLL